MFRACHDGGVVDEDVQGTVRIKIAPREQLNAVLIGQVQLLHLDVVSQARIPQYGLGVLKPPGGYCYGCARGHQGPHRLQSQSRITARDDRAPAGKVDS